MSQNNSEGIIKHNKIADEQIAELNNNIGDMEDKIAELEFNLARDATKIINLRRKNEEYACVNEMLHLELTKQRCENRKLESSLARQVNHHALLRKQREDREFLLARQQEKFEDLLTQLENLSKQIWN